MSKGLSLKLFLTLISIFSLCWTGFWVFRGVLESKGPANDHQKVILEAARRLSSAWTKGRDPRSEGLICPEHFSFLPMPAEVLKCNPLFMKCLFSERPIEVELKGKKEKVSFSFENKENLPYQMIAKSRGKFRVSDFALEVKIKTSQREERVWLEDVCSMVYLPKRIYAVGKMSSKKNKGKKEDFIWDNFDRHIFIDRRQITNREIYEWLEQTKNPLLSKYKYKNDKEKHYWPAGDLSLEEMKNFCSYRGKQLAQAHILDAAFFFPGDIENNRSRYILRGPYPWTRNKKNKIAGKGCGKILSEDCKEEISMKDWFSSSATWNGAFHALGGVMEYTYNPRYPRRNLNLSSWYLPKDSPAHAIGVRGYWDGQDHHFSRFSFGLHKVSKKFNSFNVGFRCMKEGHQNENI